MTSSPSPSAPLKELLRKVIEAQVKGGYEKWIIWGDLLRKGNAELDADGLLSAYGGKCLNNALIFLLDTAGAKAAYLGWCCEDCGEDGEMGVCRGNEEHPWRLELWKEASRKIHWAWHSGPGNNSRAALETAVSFLP
jgi:hypothetical protein